MAAAGDEYDPTPSEDELEAHLQTRNMVVNLGPSHPATHGTVRIRIELDGETIVKMDPEIGFLHRGFQKSAESVTWTQVLPYTDRLDYVASMQNNFGYLTAVEALIGVEIPERAKYIRVVGAELHRLSSHLTTAGALSLELGGFGAFLYAIEARDRALFVKLVGDIGSADLGGADVAPDNTLVKRRAALLAAATDELFPK